MNDEYATKVEKKEAGDNFTCWREEKSWWKGLFLMKAKLGMMI